MSFIKKIIKWFTIVFIVIPTLFVMLLMFMGFGGQETELSKDKTGQALANSAQKKQQRFEGMKPKIISKIQNMIKSGSFTEADDYAKEYISAGVQDTELLELRKQARTKALTSEAQITPTKKYSKNLSIYEELQKLNPDNSKFKKKVTFYRRKIEQIKKDKELLVKKFGKKPKASAWDGSYREIEKYLKAVAREPASIKIGNCSSAPSYDPKNGWLVACEFRGKNGFGGMTRNANWFVIKHGRVVKKLPISAYKVN